MRHPARYRTLCVGTMIVLCLPASLAGGQPSGTLIPSVGRASERQETFAILVVDPSLTSPLRSSAWAISVSAFQSSGEARIQVNLCDLGTCGDSSGFDFTLVGPIQADKPVTELADLNGLIGMARGELGLTWRLASKEPIAVSGRVAAGYPRFDFRPLPDLSEAHTRKLIGSAAVFGSWKWSNAAARVGWRYEQSYRKSSAHNICTPFTGGAPGTLQCDEYVLAGPSKSIKSVVELEGRVSLRIRGFGLGMRAIGSRDYHGNVTGVDVPIYFLPNPAGGLGGGLRVGYRNDAEKDRSITVSVFVGDFKL